MGGQDAEETLRPTRDGAGRERALDVGTVAAGRYRIDRFIAAGGMGEVYAAHDLVLDAEVALKTLRPELAGSTTAIERLRREIALARAVTDPHVCRLHDVGEHEGRVFLTMELVDGKTLAELVKDGPLPVAEAERIARQLVAGLSALHRAGTIHRDFKTSNVIVEGERAVITDFGLARSVEAGDVVLTLESSLVGTPAYMAPEQVEARPATIASDIYSFGVVLFEMLTGVLPFREDTAMATATARLYRDAPKPSSIRDDVPARWDAIVVRCLARDPAARPARIEDVFEPVARSRRWFLAAAGGGGLLALTGIGAWRACVVDEPRRRLGPDDRVAVLPVEGEGELVADPWRTAITVDLHRALATSAIPMLALYEIGMNLGLAGPAMKLLGERDPVAAALAIENVTTVVRTRIARRSDEIEIVASIEPDGWEQSFTRPLDEIALLIIDVATAIAVELKARVPHVPGDAPRINSAVYERYGQALSWLYTKRTRADNAAIVNGTRPGPRARLGELVEASPWLARAAAILADHLEGIGEQADHADAKPMRDASVAVDRALAVDPQCALALAVRGHIALVHWQWKVADDDTRRADELAPTDDRVGYHRALLLMLAGRFDEAIPRFERDRTPSGLIWAYYYARRWGEIVKLGERWLDKLDFTNWIDQVAAASVALAYAEMARASEAVAVADRIRPKLDDYALASLVTVYAMGGRIDDAKAIRAKIGETAGLDAAALMADALGDTEGALDALERLVASHQFGALLIKIERYSFNLRATPRFQALLKRVGFP